MELSAATLKPRKTVLLPGNDARRIFVKFQDGLDVRLRGQVLTSTNAAFLAKARPLISSFTGSKWDRTDAIDENTFDQLRRIAEQRLGRRLPDLNLEFYLTLPPGADAAATIDALNKLDTVELAQPAPRAMPAPLAPNFEPDETNDQAAPIGSGIFAAWTDYLGCLGRGFK